MFNQIVLKKKRNGNNFSGQWTHTQCDLQDKSRAAGSLVSIQVTSVVFWLVTCTRKSTYLTKLRQLLKLQILLVRAK